MDTIYALATGRGKSGLAVIRISGPAAKHAARAFCGALPPARRAGLRRLVWAGEVLDEALVLVFDGPESFTGEDVVEFHLHGSGAVVSAVLRALSEQAGLRMAEAGEFTRRALEQGRLDLTQVEGLADLIDSETEAQRRQALRVLSGAIGQRTEAWRRDLVRAAALIEASIDFAEEDVPEDVVPEVSLLLDRLCTDLSREAAGSVAAERIRDGFEVAIVGAPNAGKSTLLNALARREAAITSSVAGTTRDVIEVRMDLGGLPVTLLDTAGLREASDEVETIGIARAIARAEAADLRIFLLEGAEIPLGLAPGPDDLVVRAKADLGRGSHGGLAVSGLTGQGLPDLVAAVQSRLGRRVTGDGILIRERHRLAIGRAIKAVESAQNALKDSEPELELVAEHVRGAMRALDVLTGRVDVEDLLDEIFSSFCIGK